MKSVACLTPYTKINSKGTNVLNQKAKTIKVLEENIEVNIHNIAFSNGFSDMIPKAQGKKKRIDFSEIKKEEVH